MTQENKELPLYKRLNKERTQGDWKADESSNGIDFLIQSPMPGDTLLITLEDGKGWMYRNERKAKANVQYTALSVNNLAYLAEALESLHKLVTMTDLAFTPENLQAKEALNRIS